MSSVNQTVQNFANDLGIDLPSKFSRIEIAAAIMADYHDNHGVYPDRHQFIAHIPIYQKSIKSDSLEAAVVIATAAAKLLGLPGLKTDAQRVADARQTIQQAEADLLEAEAERGRRMSRTRSLEQIIKDLTSQRQAWEIDFVADTADAEAAILEHWGKGYSCGGLFDDLTITSVLKRLQPAAFKMIDSKVAEAQAELDELKKA